jgi:hypothetical protein
LPSLLMPTTSVPGPYAEPGVDTRMENSVARHRWEQLPDDVRDAISAQAGPITSVQHVEAGSVADFTATLSAGAGVFICKGALLEPREPGSCATR